MIDLQQIIENAMEWNTTLLCQFPQAEIALNKSGDNFKITLTIDTTVSITKGYWNEETNTYMVEVLEYSEDEPFEGKSIQEYI